MEEERQIFTIARCLVKDHADFESLEITEDVADNCDKVYTNTRFKKTDIYSVSFESDKVTGTDSEKKEKIIAKAKELQQKYKDFEESLIPKPATEKTVQAE